MIGGSDIVLKTTAGFLALDIGARIIRISWPNAVFEDAITGKVFGGYGELPFSSLLELFIYRDANAYEKWEELGADPSNENNMIHLLSSESTLTIVMDNPDDPTMSAIVGSIQTALSKNYVNPRIAA